MLAVGTGSPASIASSETSFAPFAFATSLIRFKRSAFANALAVRHKVGLSSFFMTRIIPKLNSPYHRFYINAEIPNSPPRLTLDEIFGLSHLAHNDNLRYGPRFKQ
jgi:hypothetical protein